MQQHPLDNTVGTLPMIIDFPGIGADILHQPTQIFPVSLRNIRLHFAQFLTQFRSQINRELCKIIHKVQRVLDLMSDASRELSQGCHLFGLHQLGLGCNQLFILST